jgi:imidazolonepropionase-like amidohydrolase
MRWLTLIASLLSLGGCARPDPVETTAFVNVNLLPLDEDRVIPDQTVLVQNGKIAAIGRPAPKGARIIDGRGKYLMPGLTDMHTHLIREGDLSLFVARGVTTVRNMWGTPMQLEWRERIKKGELLGPTVYMPGPIVDGAQPEHDGSLVITRPEEANSVVQLHQKMGYEFIKVYSGLSAPVFAALVTAAHGAGLSVAGHVPREVGLWGVVEAGQNSIEHMAGLRDFLKGDESKLPALAQKLKDKGVWSCPTRVVKVSFGLDAAETRARLARPEMRYVPACDRAIWEPMPDDPEQLAKTRKALALDDHAIRALHQAGARLLVGSDTVNPLVVPGYSLHEELRLLHADGLTPREVLRAATHDAAEFLGREDEFGSLKPGQRADLLLLDANPLEDLANSERIAGVMVRGRWLPAPDLAALLEKVAAEADALGRAGGELPAGGERELFARYQVTWRDAQFGGEKVLIETLADGRRQIVAESFDPHMGQRVRATFERTRLVVESDGGSGRGRVTLTRQGGRVHVEGQVLSGVPASLDEDLPADVLVGVDHFLAGNFLVVPRLSALAVGQSIQLKHKELALGSTVELRDSPLQLTRIADGKLALHGADVAVRRYQLTGGGLFAVDEKGVPFLLELPVFGDTVRILRVD